MQYFICLLVRDVCSEELLVSLTNIPTIHEDMEFQQEFGAGNGTGGAEKMDIEGFFFTGCFQDFEGCHSH